MAAAIATIVAVATTSAAAVAGVLGVVRGVLGLEVGRIILPNLGLLHERHPDVMRVEALVYGGELHKDAIWLAIHIQRRIVLGVGHGRLRCSGFGL